ncbi:MAG: BatA domain-containing protein [Crocinitomicaceae bacterium]
MKFLYPEFLWAFAILIIPIIIHLFNFKRYKTLYFSSLTFVNHVDQQTKSTQKLKHLLVLFSRLLAFIFLILAFSQPYLSDEKKNTPSKSGIIAFYIDNSFSMQAIGANGELLSEAIENAREIIKKAALSTRFLIGTNTKSGSEERILSKIEALEKLDQIDLSPLTRSIDEIIQWQSERLVKSDIVAEGTSTQYIILSDFQSASSFSKDMKSLTLNPNSSFYPIKLSPESSDNIFIDSIWFTTPIHKLGAKKELNIQINNPSDSDLKNVELSIDIEEYKNTILIDLPKNESTATQIGYTDKSIGTKTGEIRLYDNHVQFDDTYFLTYEVRQNVNILLLDGEDAVENIETVLNLDEFYITDRKNITSITREDFVQKDLIIVNGANTISKGAINYITTFASTGGTVSLFPGKSPNSADWNELLLTLNLPTIAKTITSGNKIKTLNYDDPFFSGVFQTKSTNLNLPSVTKVYQAIKNSKTLGKSLIELQNGLPLLAFNEQIGKSFMFYSSLHSDFGNFTKDVLFTAVLLRTGELSQRNQPEYIIIGKSSRYPVYAKTNGETPIHIIGNGIDFIPKIATASGVKYLSLSNTPSIKNIQAGNYTIKTDKNIGGISLNYDRKESLLSSHSEEEIIVHFQNRGIQEVTFNEINGYSTAALININKPFSFWKLCIILTFTFVLLEMIFVRFLN